MAWTAVVPLKAAAERKSRLAPIFDAERRRLLSDTLFHHVLRCIAETRRFEEVIVLSPAPPDPEIAARWWLQEGEGVNEELGRVRAAFPARLMVIHADLPLLEPDDLIALALAAEGGACAIAPDRHGLGTNAVALMPDVPFAFCFGPDSLDAHLRAAPATVRLVRRTGLAHDLDTADDVQALLTSQRSLSDGIKRCLEPSER